MSGHGSCCKGRKAPKTVSQFAALNYPPNASGHRDQDNRIHNPEHVPVTYVNPKQKVTRGGWWFRMKPDAHPPLFDGSGDGKPRGTVGHFADKGIVPKTPTDRLLCFNAANLKTLPMPGGGKEVCAFTWYVTLNKNQPSDAAGSSVAPASGWVSLSSVAFEKESSRKKTLAALKNWACCMRAYARWGRALTKKKPEPYVFRTVKELAATLLSLRSDKKKVKRYFRDDSGRIKKLLRKADGDPRKLRDLMGIATYCKNGNRLTDYLPRGADYKNGGNADGYTNMSGNVSVGKQQALMAPIGVDIFPAGHEFHRLSFKKNQQVLGFLYRVPKKNPAKKIGRFVWYYGYCDVVSGDRSERRYGWVPALALKKKGAAS